MSRLPKLLPEDLDDAQRAVYDSIAGGRRAEGRQLFRLVDEHGGLEGPFNALLLQPRLGHALQALGAAVRYETTLPLGARTDSPSGTRSRMSCAMRTAGSHLPDL